MSRDLIGSCTDCGRRYKLVNGRPAEIGRTERPRLVRRASPKIAPAVKGRADVEAS